MNTEEALLRIKNTLLNDVIRYECIINKMTTESQKSFTYGLLIQTKNTIRVIDTELKFIEQLKNNERIFRKSKKIS